MENRRQHFRYALNARFYWKAQFGFEDEEAVVLAEIVNLSVGGICVKLEKPAQNLERCFLLLALSIQDTPLQIPVQRVHGEGDAEGLCGFRFLPLANAQEQEEQDRRICRFLLDAQRRDRRHWSQE